MFIALLRFAENKDQLSTHMDAHKAWIKQGFDDGVFIMAGSLQPQQGGSVFAHNINREEFEALVAQDPFVANKVVSAEILEISPGKAIEELNFLLPAES